MVQEVRRIVLNTDEVAEAIDTYRQITPDFLPHGNIIRCATSKFGSVAVFIEIPRDGAARTAEYTIGQTQVLRLLIAFCLKNRIPLPRDGRKVALISKDSVALYITRDVNCALPPGTAMELEQITLGGDLLGGEIGH